MSQQNERRFVDASWATRAADADGGPVVLSGYAVRYETPTVLYESDDYRLVETIKRGACKRAVSSGQDVRFLVDHAHSAILGRTSAGTLRLRDDPEGLFFEATLPNTQLARDLIENIRVGNITQCSFGFRPAPDGEAYRSRSEGGKTVVEIDQIDVDLFDVSAVTFPAYPTTSVGIKSRCLGFVKSAWLDARRDRFRRIDSAYQARKGK